MSGRIKKLNSELAKVQDEIKVVENKVVEKKGVDEPLKDKKEAEVKDETKRCRYYNKGFCKYKKVQIFSLTRDMQKSSGYIEL
jgi:hypothetical protein